MSMVLAGCARFEPRPLSIQQTADAFSQRTLADDGLAGFLASNGVPARSEVAWDLERLTLAAFFFHPDMDLARAHWHSAMAGQITADQRPNPNLAFTPRLNSTSVGSGLTPWILGGALDIPVETMGKHKYRVAQARHLGEMARLDLANTAWLVRSRVRNSLLSLQAAQETAFLERDQADTLGRVARLVEIQWEAGAVSSLDVSLARVAHQNVRLSLLDAQRQQADARGQLAEAIGVPLRALESVKLSFPDLALFPTNLTSDELQRQAVLNRADVLSALAEYAASEAALQLQIAKQYPDIHLRPGYEYDQAKNKWQLGVSFDLPILHQNQGPIAEAKAKREEIAAKFNAVQAQAIGELDRATAVYIAAVDQAASAGHMLATLEKSSAAMTRKFEAGEVDRLAVSTAQAEYLNGALARLKARLQAQHSLAALENATQSPLLLPAQPAQLERAAGHTGQTKTP
jgi:outer membrane protein, heavy metal efflux system